MSIETPTYSADDDPTIPLLTRVNIDSEFNLTDLADEQGKYDARGILTTIVNLDAGHSLIQKRYSQTPLDPSMVLELGVPYMRVVANELTARVDQMALRVKLQDETTVMAIQSEVGTELIKRTRSNDKAASRLFEYLKGQKLSPDDANLIWRAKTGEATMAEVGLLLLRYPVMESIEAFKYTEPLSWDLINAAAGNAYKGIGELNKLLGTIGGDFTFTPIPESADERQRRPLVPKEEPEDQRLAALQAAIAGWKENIAEVTLNGVTIQLVQKTTMIKIDPHIKLDGVQPFVKDYFGGNTNLQPIARSWYWRVKPESGEQ